MENLCTPEICTKAQNFAAVQSAIVMARRNGEILELLTLQCWKMSFCKIGDLLESQSIVCHSICDSSLLCSKDNYTLPIDRNPNAHVKCFILYITNLEIFHCTSET